MRSVGESDTVSGVVVRHRVVDDIVMGCKIEIDACFQIVVDLRIDDSIVMRVGSEKYTILAVVV